MLDFEHYTNLLIFSFLQAEVQVRRIYCIHRAMPTLPINIEDAARSEVEIEKALQVAGFFPFIYQTVFYPFLPCD